jgi:hypothetical protein
MKHLMLYEEWCYAGRLDTETLPPINEDFLDSIGISNLSDVLHLVGDVAAGVADVIVPGSGAAIDFTNMISYFIQASLSSAEADKFKYILSGLIQAFMLFDPLNILAALKLQLNSIFRWFVEKNPATQQAAVFAAQKVAVGLTTMKNGLSNIVGKILAKLADSKFGQVVAQISAKLGVKDVLVWAKNFFTTTVPTSITKFLNMLKALNPKAIGNTVGEGNELLLKTVGKIAINKASSTAFNSKAISFAEQIRNYKPGRYSSGFGGVPVVARDNTYVAPKPFPKPVR